MYRSHWRPRQQRSRRPVRLDPLAAPRTFPKLLSSLHRPAIRLARSISFRCMQTEESLRQIIAAGERFDVEFKAESGEPLDDRELVEDSL